MKWRMKRLVKIEWHFKISVLLKEYPLEQQNEEYPPQQRRVSREEQRRMSLEQNWVKQIIN